MTNLTFVFPKNEIHLEKVLTASELRERIRFSADVDGVDRNKVRYKVTRVRHFMYAKCKEKGCSASLNYRETAGTFNLMSATT